MISYKSVSRSFSGLASDALMLMAVGGALLLAPVGSNAQETKDDVWSVPRTSAGHPVLQGHWTNSTVIPMQRPEELGDKAFYTEEEIEEFARQRLVVTETTPGTAADVHYKLDDFGLDRTQNTVAVNMRTSILIDPPNGRLPEPTAAARELMAATRAYRAEHGYDSAQNRPLAERCVIWPHEVPPMTPVGYNSNFQIMQTDDHVVVLIEMLHDARIIPLNDNSALPQGVTQWLGDSRGRWEGDTLVVETTSFTGETANRAAGGVPTSKDSRVTERFTRTGEDSILYEFTVDDPSMWTQPWSGEYAMAMIDGPMFEYACHEGNYGLANILSGQRFEEQRAAQESASR
ncbi:hypothetical protein [Candidatus Rariloculus sp.]|uniref:hypothetical protein n=1 Tax=Candidatus Rariloculus sp. TaxID=3101265 RepID=UPI003D0FF1B5